jgi:F-type H+-transporting ATPase subunit gamma
MAESLQSLKTRLKSVKNIGQITKAMELVAATKMRRSQEIALSSRPYTLSALDMLATLLQIEGVQMPALLQARPIEKTAIVVVTSDKGLAGAFNSAVLRAFEAFLKKNEIDPTDSRYTFIAVGQRALSYLERRTPNLSGKFVRFGDYTTKEEIKPLTERLIEGYLNAEWDEVVVFSTHFRSALRQDVLTRRVFPVATDALAETAQEVVPEHGRFAEMIKERKVTFFNRDPEVLKEYLIEPSPEVVLESLARHLVEAEIYQLVLEANASEWAARRMAMKSASDNASDLAQGYTLQYNKSRQASITREIIEITAGAESMQ